ncbi:ribose-5-phosphate isomerase RpiA [Fundicoccus culcitae]|uniref:Ribose-5-phosphate isomerase A n=1 Tax=Fundicoccus culcitae TaxID=2969821 RepID=A0ABY5P9Q1_9LACT|nr:ribose-5-phosphate isomerase RpiA [Fundicoccus culcitae]UUX35486.1 ribose-5-phosphate isomerase RpiA [Fundicoccus culcitae]
MNPKEVVGRKAADYIEDGMVVGLGTGSTAYWFIDELGLRFQAGTLANIVGVATSKQSEDQARKLGIPVVDIDEVNHIDVLVDGADECTTEFSGIKGGGGALLMEKIVAQHSRTIIWIVTQEKIVDTLGAFPLPVEIVKYGSWKLFRQFDQAGMHPTFRKKGVDSIFITDQGNYIIDLHLEKIPNPQQTAFELKNLVGVVEHGLFINYPDIILAVNDAGEIVTYKH